MKIAGALRIGYQFETAGGNVMPFIRTEYEQEVKGANGAASVFFADDPTRTLYAIAQQTTDRNVVNVGGGIQAAMDTGLNLRLEYSATLGSEHQHFQQLMLGFVQQF